MLIPCPQACYSLPTNLWWSCAGQFSGSLKEPSYETTSWCESVLSWPEVLWALGQNVKIIGGWADGDGDHQPATTWPPQKPSANLDSWSTCTQHYPKEIYSWNIAKVTSDPKIPQQIHVVWLAGLIWYVFSKYYQLALTFSTSWSNFNLQSVPKNFNFLGEMGCNALLCQDFP